VTANAALMGWTFGFLSLQKIPQPIVRVLGRQTISELKRKRERGVAVSELWKLVPPEAKKLLKGTAHRKRRLKGAYTLYGNEGTTWKNLAERDGSLNPLILG